MLYAKWEWNNLGVEVRDLISHEVFKILLLSSINISDDRTIKIYSIVGNF